MGDFGSGSANRGHVSLFIHRGRLLAYERGHLTAIITPQGVSRDGEIANDQFEKLGLFSSLNWGQIAGQIGTNPLMVDASGLYQFDSNTFALNQLLPKTPDKVCLLYADDRSPATIWTVNGETLTQHLVSTIEDGIELTEEALTENHTVGIPLIKIDSSKEHKIDSLDMEHSISVFRGDDGRYGYVQYNIKTNEHFYGMLEEDGGVAKVGPVVVPPFINPQITSWALGIPPLFGYVGVIENLFFDQRGIFSPWEILGFTISQALLAAVGTLLLCKWRAYY